MKLSDRGLFALALHEGIVPGPYWDSVRVLTYGIGHTAAAGEPNPADLPFGMPDDIDFAVKDAVEVFKRDVAKYEADVNGAVNVTMAQHEFDALVSFHYNTGGIRRATLTRKLNAGDREGAADAFMGWSKPDEIIPRRKEEQKLFRDGSYPSGRAIVWGCNESGAVLWKPQRTYAMSEFLALLRPPEPMPDPLPEPDKPMSGTRFAALLAALSAALAGGYHFFFGG